MNNKLSLKNINDKYGESLYLKSIDLDIYEGEFVAILGSSGAGKSTRVLCVSFKRLFWTIYNFFFKSDF